MALSAISLFYANLLVSNAIWKTQSFSLTIELLLSPMLKVVGMLFFKIPITI